MEEGRVHGAVPSVRSATDVEWSATRQVRPRNGGRAAGQVHEALGDLCRLRWPWPVSEPGPPRRRRRSTCSPHSRWLPSSRETRTPQPLSCTFMTTRRAAKAAATGGFGMASCGLFNLLQFLPGAWWTTRVGVEHGICPEFAPAPVSRPAIAPTSDLSIDDWKEVIELASPDVHGLLAQLSARRRAQCPKPAASCSTVEAPCSPTPSWAGRLKRLPYCFPGTRRMMPCSQRLAGKCSHQAAVICPPP